MRSAQNWSDFPAPWCISRNTAATRTRLAREAADNGCGVLIAAGGDGTLNEVLNGMAPHADRLQVGLLPLGTGNDFAKMLDLPEALDDCIDVLREGHVRPTDLVRVTTDEVRYFINVSAGGFSGTVNEKMTPEIKESWGPLAYLRCAAEALPGAARLPHGNRLGRHRHARARSLQCGDRERPLRRRRNLDRAGSRRSMTDCST